MTDNNKRSTIYILRKTVAVTKQLILLDALEKLLEGTQDGDEVKFLPLLISITNYASQKIGDDASLQAKVNLILARAF